MALVLRDASDEVWRRGGAMMQSSAPRNRRCSRQRAKTTSNAPDDDDDEAAMGEIGSSADEDAKNTQELDRDRDRMMYMSPIRAKSTPVVRGGAVHVEYI